MNPTPPSKIPRWLTIARWLALAGLPVMLFNCWYTYSQGQDEFGQILATTLVLVGCTHLAWRAPYRVWRRWEWPLVLLSIGSAATGAYLFTPDEEERELAFQAFFGLYVGLAMAYGFFCTTTAHDDPKRKHIIEPSKRVAGIGIAGFDIGLVLCPFAFVFHWLRYRVRSPQRSAN